MHKNFRPVFGLFVGAIAFVLVASRASARGEVPTVYVSNVSVGVGQTATGTVYITEGLPGVTNYYTGRVSVNSTFAHIVSVDFNQTLIANLGCQTSVINPRKNPSEVIFSVSCRKSISGTGVLAHITYKGLQSTGRSKQFITPSGFIFNKNQAMSVPGILTVSTAIAELPNMTAKSVTLGVGQIATASAVASQSLTGLKIYSYEAKLSVNPVFAKITGVSFDNTVIANSDCITAVNLGTNLQPGEVKFAVACSKPLGAPEALANITYKGLQSTGRSKQFITISEAKFNESAAIGRSGIITVTGLIPKTTYDFAK